jgi:uncharacterized membrane protein
MQFRGSVRKDIARWQEKGLIDSPTAQRLNAEIEEAGGGFGLGGVLGVLGALLIGAAVITVVASNWEAIPRLARVIGIVAFLWVAWIGGAWREQAGDRIFSQTLYLIGALSFGAGIALVGQMYHLSGDAASAALVWTLGTLFAAALLRSPIATATASGTGILYLTAALTESSWHSNRYLMVAALIAVAVALLAHWNASRMGKHGAVWLLLAAVISYRVEGFSDHVSQLDYIFAFGGAALFVAMAFAEPGVEKLTGFAHPLLGYALALSFTGFAVIQTFYDYDRGSTAVLGLLVLALAIGALVLKGRDHGGVRALSYTAFGAEILYLASETIGSILGTSAFFLLSGVIVMVIAWLMVRIEKRLKAQALEGTPA